ncbi:MAG: hypothetical protein FH756_04320 [Firmicutes bacterium]|nr:hypothetical protein [Bacillota bacterium]
MKTVYRDPGIKARKEANNSNRQGDEMLVMLNFEDHDVSLDVGFGEGRWIKLADIDNVNDLSAGNQEDLPIWTVLQ